MTEDEKKELNDRLFDYRSKYSACVAYQSTDRFEKEKADLDEQHKSFERWIEYLIQSRSADRYAKILSITEEQRLDIKYIKNKLDTLK